MSRRRSWAAPAALGLAWVAGLIATVLVLHALGTGALAPPPLRDRAALERWLDQRHAVVAALALVRVAGLGLAGYLVAVTALGLAARLTGVPALVAAADLATLPAVRRLLGAAAGLSLTATTAGLAGGDPLPATSGPAPTIDHRRTARSEQPHRPDEPGVHLTQRDVDGRLAGPGRHHGLRPRADPEGSAGEADGDGTATMEVDEGLPPDPPSDRREWRVTPGQSFWEVAEAELTRSWDRTPTDGDVGRYWSTVVEANRDRLASPTDPDLIFPGQVFTLPPPPP